MGEYLNLFLVGTGNLFYNLGLFFYEALIFGTCFWWWRVRFLYSVQYLFSRINTMVEYQSCGQEYSRENFTFGETPAITMKRILQYTNCGEGDLFIDLGAGRGQALVYAHYIGKSDCRGYELLPGFSRMAGVMFRKLGIENIRMINDDILDAGLDGAKLIYMAGTTFDGKLIEKIEKKLCGLNEDVWIVTLSFFLNQKYFEVVNSEELYFSWGKSHVYYHRRRIKGNKNKD